MANQTVTGLLTDEAGAEVYRELERLAAAFLRREGPGQTLRTGTLVHEAYLRLARQRQAAWQNRAHFFGIAALMMRRILVEHSRSRHRARVGSGALHLSLDALGDLALVTPAEILLLDEALHELARSYPQAARIVELRYFGGLSEGEAGELLGLSVPTVKRRWRMARAWLHRYLTAEGSAHEA